MSSFREARRKSIEYIYPDEDSADRQATLTAAVFSLISTIIGGGVLSLPYAFARAGILIGLAFLVFIALISDFSVYILVSCSRRSGGVSYEQVAKIAFGRWAQILTMILLFLLTFLCCVAYIILMGDLFTPLTEFIFGLTLGSSGRRIVSTIILGLIFPVCFFDSLNSLRFTSFLSILSMIVLAICVFIRAAQRLLYPETLLDSGYRVIVDINNPLIWWNPSWHDAVFAFPIVSVAYLCHFNVLPLHAELVQPTRSRIKVMIHWVMGLCTGLYSFIGVLGYVYARAETDGNVLNNFDVQDGIMSVGRLALGATLALSFPLLVLPARHQAFRLWCVFFYWIFPRKEIKSQTQNNSKSQESYHGFAKDIERKDSSQVNYGSLQEEEEMEESHAEEAEGPSLYFKVISTTLICVVALILACLVPSVATIWSLTGSTISITIAYILPAACYLQIRKHKKHNHIRIWAWGLLIVGVVSLLFCTYQSICSVLVGSVPTAAPGH